MELEELLIYLVTPTAQVALIMALAEVAKKIGLDAKFVPVLDLVLGILSGVVVFGILGGQNIILSVVAGIALGLSACGLFSGVKNVKQSITEGK